MTAPRHPRVIIVEDDPDMLLLLRASLEAAGFDTSLAADGTTAIRRIDAERPDVVLLDLMLPGMDGWAILADMRGRLDSPPFVVCSARGSPSDLTRAHEMGAAAYVVKPFAMEELVAVMQRVLTRGSQVEGIEPA